MGVGESTSSRYQPCTSPGDAFPALSVLDGSGFATVTCQARVGFVPAWSNSSLNSGDFVPSCFTYWYVTVPARFAVRVPLKRTGAGQSPVCTSGSASKVAAFSSGGSRAGCTAARFGLGLSDGIFASACGEALQFTVVLTMTDLVSMSVKPAPVGLQVSW